MNRPDESNTGPVIRDLRRIDPATGQPRDPGQGQRGQAQRGQAPQGQAQPGPARPRGKHAAARPGGGTPGNGAPGEGSPGTHRGGGQPAPDNGRQAPGLPPAGGPDAQDFADALAERTADLQRITAEYANYRKRVERDRIVVREQALANVLVALLPVLDDIGRARQHEELTGGFKSVAESLEAIAAKLGLTAFGEAGEPFDPNVHEALMHSYSADVTEPTCVQILQPGYKVGERILRPARVAVAEPAGGPEPDQPGAPEDPAEYY
jgi:molecular chaperone GrpE